MNQIDIVGMQNRKVPTGPKAHQHMHDDIEFYMDITKKLVVTICPRYSNSLAYSILNNDDAMSNIATQIMFADWRWNGTGNIEGYRKQCAIWAIYAFINRQKKRRPSMPLNKAFGDGGNDFSTLISASETYNPAKEAEVKEEFTTEQKALDEFYNGSNLSHTQKQCLKMRYLDNMEYDEISKKLEIKTDTVQKAVSKGIDTLRSQFDIQTADQLTH